jgi:hypothetical protein
MWVNNSKHTMSDYSGYCIGGPFEGEYYRFTSNSIFLIERVIDKLQSVYQESIHPSMLERTHNYHYDQFRYSGEYRGVWVHESLTDLNWPMYIIGRLRDLNRMEKQQKLKLDETPDNA